MCTPGFECEVVDSGVRDHDNVQLSEQRPDANVFYEPSQHPASVSQSRSPGPTTANNDQHYPSQASGSHQPHAMSVFSSDVPMPTQYQRSLGQTEGDWPVQPPWPNEEYEVDLSQRSDHIQQEYRREGIHLQSRSYELTSSGDKSFEQDSRHVGAQFEPYKPEDTASTVEYDTDTSSHFLASEHSFVDEDGFQNRPLLSSGRYSNHSDNNNAGMSSPTSPHLFSTDPTTFSLNSFDYMSSNSRSSSQSPSFVSTDRPATVTRCELCPGKEFTGQAQSQRRSLRRHNHIVHGIDPRPSCSFLGCGESFSRGDNKKRHMEQQHGIVPPPKRPATQKRRADEEP